MSERLSDEQLDRWQWFEADDVQALVAEVRARRAALTEFEVMTLEILRNRIDADDYGDRAMVAVLDKVLALHDKEGGR